MVKTDDEDAMKQRVQVLVDGAVVGKRYGTYDVPICAQEMVLNEGEHTQRKNLNLREGRTNTVSFSSAHFLEKKAKKDREAQKRMKKFKEIFNPPMINASFASLTYSSTDSIRGGLDFHPFFLTFPLDFSFHNHAWFIPHLQVVGYKMDGMDDMYDVASLGLTYVINLETVQILPYAYFSIADAFSEGSINPEIGVDIMLDFISFKPEDLNGMSLLLPIIYISQFHNSYDEPEILLGLKLGVGAGYWAF